VFSLAVVIIGGRGSLEGAAFGALLVGLLNSIGQVMFPELAYFVIFGPMYIPADGTLVPRLGREHNLVADEHTSGSRASVWRCTFGQRADPRVIVFAQLADFVVRVRYRHDPVPSGIGRHAELNRLAKGLPGRKRRREPWTR